MKKLKFGLMALAVATAFTTGIVAADTDASANPCMEKCYDYRK
ncbi:hypothetical protein [Pseudalkalibacillus sp. SCS-8]